jgi:glycyl-tRNA synthetase beta chain
MPDFLLEIGTEEIPARMIQDALEELRKKITLLLVGQYLHAGGYDDSTVYSTTRRLAIFVPNVAKKRDDFFERVLGPTYEIGFKDGKPTPAALGFAKKTGTPIGNFIELYKSGAVGRMGADIPQKGRLASELLAELLPIEIASIYWPKNMYWRSGKPERFVRPVRWIVALLDGEIIPLEFGGIKAGDQSRGHRILGPERVSIAAPAQYVELMRGVHVAAAYADREYKIRKALDEATRTVADAHWREDAELLKTVVNLTEWPSAILGSFDKQFLSLPEEVLVTVMRDHQKYFAVEDAGTGWLLPYFLAVLNTDGDPDGLIRHGNERVLRARFNDARFFWDTDQKTPLKNRVNMLRTVTFQKDLGSYFDKAERMVNLAERICPVLVGSGMTVESNVVQQAAWLAKTDLTTELVKEFTELQGIVGGLYAKAQDQPDSVADAIYDQYKPGSTEDSVPRTLEGAVLSIADKADSIAGMFALGLVPSGSKDPFALRRQANGIVKTLAKHELPVRLGNLIADSLQTYEGTEAAKNFKREAGAVAIEIYQFFRERLQFYLRDVLYFRYDAVNAVLEGAYDRGDDEVPDLVQRCKAVDGICTAEEFEPLFVAFKRIKGIVKQARDKSFEIGVFNRGSGSKVEVEVWNEIQPLGEAYLSHRKSRRYVEAFRELSKLRGPIDKYFDAVMVMVDDPEVRSNRLGVLNYLLETFNTIADLSALVKE